MQRQSKRIMRGRRVPRMSSKPVDPTYPMAHRRRLKRFHSTFTTMTDQRRYLFHQFEEIFEKTFGWDTDIPQASLTVCFYYTFYFFKTQSCVTGSSAHPSPKSSWFAVVFLEDCLSLWILPQFQLLWWLITENMTAYPLFPGTLRNHRDKTKNGWANNCPALPVNDCRCCLGQCAGLWIPTH